VELRDQTHGESNLAADRTYRGQPEMATKKAVLGAASRANDDVPIARTIVEIHGWSCGR
jgi:hypothetical protein